MKSKNENLYGVILAGGSGTRLWPISRELYPKQLLKLFGNKTLIQQTFSRIKKIINPKKIYIITDKAFVENINLQLRNLGLIKENIIIEPTKKNTGPAIALISKTIFDKDKSAIILTCPADHLIKPDQKFVKYVRSAFEVAQKDFLVTFGVIPDYPNTEYGYIKPEIKISASPISIKSPRLPKRNGGQEKSQIDGYKAEKFIEKPDIKKAEELIKENCLWNSGIFIWKAKIILEEIKKFQPAVYKAIESSLPKQYLLLQPISIDKAVLEFSKKVWVIPVDFIWRDIGLWKSLHQLLPKDSSQNVLGKNVIEHECKDCLIFGSSKRIVAAIGLENLVVVDTEDAVLVSSKDRTHEVKTIFEKIRDNNFHQYLEHPTIERPWGFFTVLEEGDNFKVKKIVVKPKEKLSRQFHNKRSEHWVVLKGKAKIELNGKIFNLKPHQAIDIPIRAKHCLANLGKESLEIIEIQNGDYLGEDDIIRIDDKYKR